MAGALALEAKEKETARCEDGRKESLSLSNLERIRQASRRVRYWDRAQGSSEANCASSWLKKRTVLLQETLINRRGDFFWRNKRNKNDAQTLLLVVVVDSSCRTDRMCPHTQWWKNEHRNKKTATEDDWSLLSFFRSLSLSLSPSSYFSSSACSFVSTTRCNVHRSLFFLSLSFSSSSPKQNYDYRKKNVERVLPTRY